MKLLHKGGRRNELKNYRPIAIISVTCKLCMLKVRKRIKKWAEESGLMGEAQGGSGKERRTKDNLFTWERVRRRNEELFVEFVDMEKTYDPVNRNKLFEVMIIYDHYRYEAPFHSREAAILAFLMLKGELNLPDKFCLWDISVIQISREKSKNRL